MRIEKKGSAYIVQVPWWEDRIEFLTTDIQVISITLKRGTVSFLSNKGELSVLLRRVGSLPLDLTPEIERDLKIIRSLLILGDT